MVWSVITHEHRERSVDWFWALGLIALAAGVASVLFGNVLFAIVIFLAAGSVGFLAARGPREHLVKIDDHGIAIDGTRYPFSSIHSFWIEHGVEFPRLFMTLKGALTPHFSLTLDSEAQGKSVREHLARHVEEQEQGPHVGEHLAQIFGL